MYIVTTNDNSGKVATKFRCNTIEEAVSEIKNILRACEMSPGNINFVAGEFLAETIRHYKVDGWEFSINLISFGSF